MRQGNRLTRAQKEVVRNNGLNPHCFMLLEEKETLLILRDKNSNAIKSVSKAVRKR